MSEKKFMSHNQQLKILRGRGLVVPTNGTPKRILEKVNYYNLINGYKDLFIGTPATATTQEQYKPGTQFSEIYALYNFDSELKAIILKRILRIEKTLKSEIAYTFSKQYGHDNYLKMANFELIPGNTQRINDIMSLITNIQNDISKQMRHNSIRHYITQYGYTPLWVLMSILTFGRISYFYQYMKQSDRQAISRIYGIMDDEMIKLLKTLTLCRNKCAHDEIIYNFNNRDAIKNNRIHTLLGIPLVSGTPTVGKHDLFSVVIALKILINKKDFNKMITEIKHIVDILTRELHVIGINDIFVSMGFPANWEDIKNI